MKRLFSSFKKGAPFVVIAALLLTLCSCGGNETVEYTIQNDRIGLQATFSLPGSAEDWEESHYEYPRTSQSYSYDPTDGRFDETKSWDINVSLSASPVHYKNVLIDGEEPRNEYESVVESDNGMKWVKVTNDTDYYYSYGTILDEYLDGYYIAEITITRSGLVEDQAETPDTELLAEIEKTLLGSFKYDTDYEGKPDYTDAAYTGSHIVKWPFEIPFEDGVIKAEEYVEDYSLLVKFKYEDSAGTGESYRVELRDDTIHDLAENENVTYLDEYYFDEDAEFKDDPYIETEIADYRAAMLFNREGHKDIMVVECAKDGADVYPVLKFFTYIDSDAEDSHNDKNKQKIIDMMTAIINSAEFLEVETDE